MKLKLLLFGLTATITLYAQTGTDIYEAKCAVCHQMNPMMDKQKMMQMSPKERMNMKKKMMQTMKAPPMSKVSAKLKFDFKEDKTAFVAFVKDYITNPSKEKSHCMPMALKRFGVMPPIGKGMSVKDIDTVANWLYDHFKQTWDMHHNGMMCNMHPKKMNTGQDKYEGMHHPPKPKAPQSMKCGQGKCGNAM